MADEEKGYRIEERCDGNTYLMLNGGCCERVDTAQYCEELRERWVRMMRRAGHRPVDRPDAEADMLTALQNIFKEISENHGRLSVETEEGLIDVIKRNGGTIDE